MTSNKKNPSTQPYSLLNLWFLYNICLHRVHIKKLQICINNMKFKLQRWESIRTDAPLIEYICQPKNSWLATYRTSIQTTLIIAKAIGSLIPFDLVYTSGQLFWHQRPDHLITLWKGHKARALSEIQAPRFENPAGGFGRFCWETNI